MNGLIFTGTQFSPSAQPPGPQAFGRMTLLTIVGVLQCVIVAGVQHLAGGPPAEPPVPFVDEDPLAMDAARGVVEPQKPRCLGLSAGHYRLELVISEVGQVRMVGFGPVGGPAPRTRTSGLQSEPTSDQADFPGQCLGTAKSTGKRCRNRGGVTGFCHFHSPTVK